MIKSFLKFSFGSWVAAGISFFTVPITTLLINPTEFGKTAMFTLSASLLFQIILLGADNSFMRFFYERKEKERSILLWSSILPALLVWGGTSVFLLLFWKNMAFFLIGEAELLVVLLLCIQLLFMIWERYAFLVIRMKQKGTCFSVIRILSAIIIPCFLITYAKVVNNDFYAILFSNILSLFLSILILIFIERKLWFSRIRIDKSLIKSILLFGTPLIFTGLMAIVFESMDKIFLRKYSTFEELGFYNVAFKIVAVLVIVQSTFSTFWIPMSYEHYEKNKEDSSLYEKMFRYMSFILVLCGLGIILLKDALILILDKQYHSVVKIVPFLVFMPIMYTLTEITTVGINFTKKTYYYLIVFGLLIIITPLFYYLIVPGFGARGAAMALALSYMAYFFLRTYFSVRLYAMKFDVLNILLSFSLLFTAAFFNTFILEGWSQFVLTISLMGLYILLNIGLMLKIMIWLRLQVTKCPLFSSNNSIDR